jgi:O-antigen/teichoic acid export membrane protein
MSKPSARHAGRIFLKNTAFVYVKSAVTKLIDILIIVAVIKALPISEFGTYSFLLGSVPLLQVFTTGGILTLFQRFIPEYASTNSYPFAKQLIRNCFLAAAPLILFVLGMLFVFGDRLSGFFNIPDLRLYLGFFSVYAFLYLCESMVGQILSTLLLQKYQAVTHSLYALLRGTLFMYLYLEDRLSLLTLLQVEAASFAFLLTLNTITLVKVFWCKYLGKREKFQAGEGRRLLRYVLFSSLNELGSTVLFIQTDYYVISHFLGPVQVGFYSFANRVRSILEELLPFRKGYEVMRSLFFSKLQDSEDIKVDEAFNFLCKLSLFFVLPTIITVAVLGKHITRLIFSAEYLGAYPVMVTLLAYIVGTSFFFVINLIVQLRERVEILLYSKVSAVYNLVASIFAAKLWGIEGVALASLTALFFQDALLYWYMKKHISLTIKLTPLLQIGVNALVAGAVTYFLSSFVSNIYNLVLVTLAGIVVFLITSFLNKAFSLKERDFLNRVAGISLWIF